MKWSEAFEKLLAGEKITQPKDEIWTKCNTYTHLKDGKIIEVHNNTEYSVSWAQLKGYQDNWPDGWEIYVAPLRFKDLQPGQKFNYVGELYPVKMKIMRMGDSSLKNCYVNLTTGQVLECCNIQEKVILVD